MSAVTPGMASREKYTAGLMIENNRPTNGRSRR